MTINTAEEWARRVQAGEPGALGELWTLLRPQLAPHWRRWRTACAEGSLALDDLEQQSFLILHELARGWPGQGAFLAWCHRLLPRRLLSYRRAVLEVDQARPEPLGEAALAQLAERPAEGPDPAELAACRQLLASLPLAYRRLLAWRHLVGLTYREIERLHGLPAASAQVECARAETWLRAAAAGECPAPLRPLRARAARPPAVVTPGRLAALWAQAGDAGLLPPAAAAARGLGLGARAYAALIARLREAGCLGTADGVPFAAHGGRRVRLAVTLVEAQRRLGEG